MLPKLELIDYLVHSLASVNRLRRDFEDKQKEYIRLSIRAVAGTSVDHKTAVLITSKDKNPRIEWIDDGNTITKEIAPEIAQYLLEIGMPYVQEGS